MRIFLIVLLFLFVSALVIISNDDLHLKNKSEAVEFSRLYYSWILSMGSNVIKTTGYIIKFEWLPNQNNTGILKNISNSSK